MVKNLLERSPDIETMVVFWDTVSDILEGKTAIVKGRTKYLPQFPKETNEEYDFRIQNTKFTNIYRDVVEGLSSKPFQNPITLIDRNGAPEELLDFIENVDGAGNNITTFSHVTFFNGINYSVDWIFVDYPTVDDYKNVTIEKAKKLNLKPFWIHVLGKNVLKVDTVMDGSTRAINLFRYQEPTYNGEPVKVRELKRLFNKETGKFEVVWRLFLQNEEDEDDFIEIDKGVMSIDFIPVVPFMTGERDGMSFKFHPAMLDAADLQITLYKNESALEHIKTLACYPMLATDGTKPPKNKEGLNQHIQIGPNVVLYGVPTENGQGGSWRYVEPQANSLEFLQKNIDKTKNDLRELGRQPLTALSTQLTTVTTSIAAGKAKSAVTCWALGLEDALENALTITLKWMGIEGYNPKVDIYTGFDDVLNNGSDVEELSRARDRGDISRRTYWRELKRRKILSAEFNFDDEENVLLDEVATDGIDTDEENKVNFNQDERK